MQNCKVYHQRVSRVKKVLALSLHNNMVLRLLPLMKKNFLRNFHLSYKTLKTILISIPESKRSCVNMYHFRFEQRQNVSQTISSSNFLFYLSDFKQETERTSQISSVTIETNLLSSLTFMRKVCKFQS